jgi:hypothetical protein
MAVSLVGGDPGVPMSDRDITDSRKFRSKRIIYFETGGHVLTLFFWKKTGHIRVKRSS